MDWLKNKLFSNKGESIGETLVSLLIGSLALTMLAGAVSSATRMILQSKEKVNEYYLETNDVITAKTDGTTHPVSLTSGGTPMAFSRDGEPLEVTIYTNEQFSGTKVISY